MPQKSPFDFDISVSADKKRRAKTRRGMTGACETSSRQCEQPGCSLPGKYRAPRHPDNLEDFIWFCLKHVRKYNLKWNYFDNQTAAEGGIDEPVNGVNSGNESPSESTTSEARAWARLGIDDPHEVLGARSTLNPGRSNRLGSISKLPVAERKAVDILGAKDHWSKQELRRQYKLLVKRLHPDMNGGDRTDEDRLQEVVWAWEQIRYSRNFRD